MDKPKAELDFAYQERWRHPRISTSFYLKTIANKKYQGPDYDCMFKNKRLESTCCFAYYLKRNLSQVQQRMLQRSLQVEETCRNTSIAQWDIPSPNTMQQIKECLKWIFRVWINWQLTEEEMFIKSEALTKFGWKCMFSLPNKT